jgi:hypothetical protein
MQWLGQLVTGLLPQKARSVHARFVVDKVHWDRFFSKFFSFLLSISFYHGSPCTYITWRMNNRPVGGRRSET